MKTNVVISSLLVFFLLSGCRYCTPKQIPDGGPCSYKTDIYPATVIDVYETDTNMFDVLMTINTPNTNGNDTIFYSSAYGRHMDSTEIKNLDVKIGSAFKYEIKQIESGSCSPYLETLIMEKFGK